MVKDKRTELSQDEKNNRKNKRKKTFLKVLIIIIAVVALFVVITSVVTHIGNNANIKKAQSFENAGARQLDVAEYEDGYVNIYCDDSLRVMQLTDVHLGGGWMSLKKDSMAINAVASMISEEKPDLVIATGDVAYPIMFQSGTINNSNGIKIFADMMESLGVYWTMTFGNHDVESHSLYSYEEIIDFLSSDKYPHCLLSTVKGSVDGYSNQVINVVNSDNVITRSFILFDSHAYVPGHIPGINWAYDNIHDNQIDWYRQVIENINESNEAAFATLSADKATFYASKFSSVPTSVFLHIPLTEYRDAWNEYVSNGHNDTENVTFIYGAAGEKGEQVFCGSSEDELFETMLELGSTDTVFCGHDHYNRFSVDYKGIKLTYGMSIDYLAYIGIYKQGIQRGCTMITYSDGTVSYKPENYYQEKYSSVYEKETVQMQ